MSNAFSYISNPGLLTPETPGTATLKFSRTNPRRPYDRGPEGLATVARRPYDRGLALAQRTTIIAVRITLRFAPSTSPGTTPARESAESTEFGV